LQSDPWEQNNLANDPGYSKEVEQMSALLKAGWSGARP